MDKMKFETPDMTERNIDKIAELFPNCVTEMKEEKGKIKRGVNFEMLKQMLSPDVVEGGECYEFTWVGKKAAIVGIGLIGSSLARMLKEYNVADCISACARSEKNRKTVLELNIADAVFEKPQEAVHDADIVFVCTPVGSIPAVIKEFMPFLKTKAIITDVGSVKAEIIKKVFPELREDVFFVPAQY